MVLQYDSVCAYRKQLIAKELDKCNLIIDSLYTDVRKHLI